MYLSAETLVQRLEQFGFKEDGSTKKVYRLSHPSLSHLLHVKKPEVSKNLILALPVQYSAKVTQALKIPVFGGEVTKSSNFKGYTPSGGSSNPALGFDFKLLEQFDAFMHLMFGLTLSSTDSSSSNRQNHQDLDKYATLDTKALFEQIEKEVEEIEKEFKEDAFEVDQNSQTMMGEHPQVVESWSSVKTRIGQDGFRDALQQYWGGYALTGLATMDLLVASHIKPWHLTKHNPDECLDVYNGLLLSPNVDKAFDKGLISFNDDGSILLSSTLSEFEWMRLGLHHGLKLRKPLEPQHWIYLDWHRTNWFKP